MTANIFTQIVNKEVPAEILYEDELCVVIPDKFPKAPLHLLVIPKKNIPSMKEVQPEDHELIGHMMIVANEMAKKNNCDGYRLQFNVGEKGGQVIFHLHLHLMGWL